MAAVVLAAAAIGFVAATETPTTDVLYLRQLGDDCSGATLLSPTTGSGEINCGYIGGFAFGEVRIIGTISAKIDGTARPCTRST